MKQFLACLFLAFSATVFGQNTDVWPPVKNHEASNIQFLYAPASKDILETPVLKQRGGTCWCFSGIDFLQLEIFRNTKLKTDLSERWILYHTYMEKAFLFAERDGRTQFSMGGEFFDILHVIQKYGVIPETAAPWLDGPNVDRLNEKLSTFMNYVVAYHNVYDALPINWMADYKKILDKYLGSMPETFEFDGKMHTAKSFAQMLKLNTEKFAHFICDSRFEPYQWVVVPFADNWLNGMAINLPYAVFSQLPIDIAQKGGSFEWSVDLDDADWNFDMGMAVVPDSQIPRANESRDFWLNPVVEEKITAEKRQAGIDAHSTTDDHGMHALALAYDQQNHPYFLVKNSWGATSNSCGGYTFASLPYVQKYTTMLSVASDYLPESLKSLLKK